MLAEDKRLKSGTVVTEADLEPYLRNFLRDNLAAKKNANIKYVINPIGDDPYAVVEEDFRIPRQGWKEGYTIPKGTVYRLP